MLTIRSRFLVLNFWSTKKINQETRKPGNRNETEPINHSWIRGFQINKSGVYKSGHNNPDSAHRFRGDGPEHFLPEICRAGTMSILPRHRTNILPRCHRYRVNPEARRASLCRIQPQPHHKEVVGFAPDAQGHRAHQLLAGLNWFARV